MLIAGGGPAGMSLAAELGWRGIPCLIVEEREGAVDHPRATLLGARSMEHYRRWDSGYSKQQSTRPQTLGYALADSPAGQAAWIVEKFWSWMECNGHPENVLTRDELLDNVMLYWLNNAATSSARLYWESFDSTPSDELQIPVGLSNFPHEIFGTSKRWAEKHYPTLIYYNDLEHGGHFPALEVPEIFVNEVRASFRAARMEEK